MFEETLDAPGNVRPGRCDTGRHADPRAELPVLRSAPAIAVDARGSSLAPDATTATADVFTALAPRAVVEGWLAQAVAAGWTERSIASNDSVATATLMRDADGRVRLLVISLARVRSGQYHALLANAVTPT